MSQSYKSRRAYYKTKKETVDHVVERERKHQERLKKDLIGHRSDEEKYCPKKEI